MWSGTAESAQSYLGSLDLSVQHRVVRRDDLVGVLDDPLKLKLQL
jgi:hypothetical protein